jgi:hypothetical protein
MPTAVRTEVLIAGLPASDPFVMNLTIAPRGLVRNG